MACPAASERMQNQMCSWSRSKSIISEPPYWIRYLRVVSTASPAPQNVLESLVASLLSWVRAYLESGTLG